ncbi:ASCH domain-containing protein [Apibacter muscae]|uniref:ASCH domain-containing protein n=1 Tax=Apibacter muscae TaxID=2509004 RepID=UPI0011ABB38F|nr:ASCH domain-containing protein [Apibacter muscae]TWP31789.1 ASCH domain-containing protein [Apibacter muscae]
MKNTLTNVILSIKPTYANAILSGLKKVEFRKKIFKKPVDKIFIYSSSPQKMIIGYFTFSEIMEDTPKNIWDKFNKVGGIGKKDFFEYFKGVEKGYSIIINSYEKFKIEIDPIEFIEEFSAPQSYIYLDDKSSLEIALTKLKKIK